jgi:PKD repeat protein
VNAGGSMTIGRGYIATGSGNVSFTGTPNNGPLAFGPTAVGAFTSFNLVGNPYPSAISAPAFVAANPGIAGSALYFWDDDGSAGSDYDAATDYAVWNNLGFVSGPNSGTVFTGNIASCQGFFIETPSSASIQFNNAMRTTTNNAFFDQNNIERLWISVTTAANDYNETLIAFKADATDGIDLQYDAKKLKGNAHISLYSKAEGSDLAIQAIPSLTSDKIVPLGIDADANGAQTIRLKHVDNIDQTSQIILEDTKLGIFQNLRNNPVYNYVFDKNSDSQRFRLHFKAGVYMSANTESCVQNDGSIIINSTSATEWTYNVTNNEGESISSGESFTGTTQINNLTGGNYFVMLTNTFGTVLQQTVSVPSGMPVSATISSSETTTEVASVPVHFHANVSGAIDYTWDFGDGTIVTGTTDPSHVYTEPGVYTVTFIASNANCMEVKTLQINVKASTTGIADVDKQTFNIYPNPAKSIAMIQLNMPERELSMTLNILDAAGKLIMSRTYEGVDKKATIEVDIADLPAGVYQMLLNGNKFSTAARLTKVD